MKLINNQKNRKLNFTYFITSLLHQLKVVNTEWINDY